MSVEPQDRSQPEVADVLACLADVLEHEPADLDPDATLIGQGLESFTAVRLRRRLREDVGLDLPLTAFLGEATARTVAAGARVGPVSPAPAAAAPSVDPGAPFPLTPIQAAYLVGRDPAFPLGGVATFYYHEFDRVPEGDPAADVARLGAAWTALVRRHPMLRMTVGADARQRVHAEVPDYAIEVTDLREAGPVDAERALARLRGTCSHQLRPADAWPLFDLRAALLPDGRARLFVGVDVLALDLTSWMVLMREWGALVADPDAALPPLPATFAELVARRDRDPRATGRRECDTAYWAARAPELPDGPALPWTASPAELGVPRFTRHSARLPALRWDALRARAAEHGLSPTGLLLAAFALVLHRFGAQDAFCLNTTLFDRDDIADGDATAGLDRVVGDFTSTVLVQVDPPDLLGWSGFAGFAAALNQRFWTDMEHRSVSGVEALRALYDSGARPRPADPRTGVPVPVHPVVFTSGTGLAGSGPAPTAWLGEEAFGVSQTPQVLLDHIVHDAGGELVVAWDAVDGALPARFVDGMRDAHATLLARLADDPHAWTDPALGWNPGLGADEPVGPNPFTATGPLLDDPARATYGPAAGAVALIEPGRSVDRAALAGRTAATGSALAALGLGPGDLVAVAAEKGAAQVTALLGVLASGAGYVPVEPAWPEARVASVCAQAGVRHALVTAGVTTRWPEGVAVHALDGDGALPAADARPRRPEPDDLAYAIFTSGSTGRPKGVAVEHRAARTTLDDLEHRLPLRADDRVLALSAFSFDLSVYDVFSVLGAGGAVVLPDPARQRDPGHWLELMAAHRVTVWNTAPALLEMLVEYAEVEPDAARRALAPLRQVFLSADWIPVTLPDRIRALAPQAQVISLGGATEASIWSIHFPIGEVDPAWPSIPYGRALGGQSFLVLDPDGRPCPVGTTGELHIGGDGLARGYAGDPAQTAERFVTHPVLGRRLYRTGDLGRWRPDGTIEFQGRLDRQVKVRGHRIELGEIEATLDRLPAVRQAVARAVPGPDDRPRLVAHVVPADPGRPPADADLRAALAAHLPPYMTPNRFVLLPELPVTDNGKIDYKALGNPYRRSPGGPGAEDTAGLAAGDGTGTPSPSGPPAVAVGTGPGSPAGAAADGCAAIGSTPAERGAADHDPTGVLSALDQGLEVRIAVGAGSLSPVDALGAAAEWATALRSELAGRGVSVAERCPEDGVVELVLAGTAAARASGAPPVPPSVVADAPPATTTPPGFAPMAAPPPLTGPDPQVERAVARVFNDLLGGPVETDVPFFQLGASSLTLVLAHRRLTDLAPDLLVTDLFGHPSVRALATRIGTSGASPAGLGLPATAAVPGPIPDAPPPPVAPAVPGAGEGPTPVDRRAARLRAADLAR